MPSFLVTLFAKRLFGPIASVLLIASAIGGVVLGLKLWAANGTIATLTKANERLAGDNATLRLNNANLTAALATQNAAVDALKAAADVAAAGARAGQAAAEVAASSHDRKATSIKALPALPAGADKAAAASELIRKTLAGEKTK